MRFQNRLIVLLAVSSALPMSAAHAYLDPGSVSIALQAIVGAVAAYIVTGKVYIQKVKSFFSRDKSETRSSDTAE